VAIGFALLGNGLGSPAWSLTLATIGLLYGLFGVLRLGVVLDIGLVGGALALAVTASRQCSRSIHDSHPVAPNPSLS
jgi:hypothetical protein